MATKKTVPIKYTSRDFQTIKSDIVDHAKRYFPDTYNDFTDVSFGSLVFDSVAYASDILSFYLDYSVNEAFLDTSIEFDNIRKHARSLGYKYSGRPVSYGTVSLFVLIPANSNGTAPDSSYYPILKTGTEFRSAGGASFVLNEDVRFSDPKNDVVAARFDPATGATTFFAVRAFGQVSSGRFVKTTANLSDSNYERFRRIRIGGNEVSEIISVIDSNGNEYYEVESLSQEVVFVETTNKNAASDGVRSILKPKVVPRRFVVEQDNLGTYIQFGFGSEDTDTTGLIEPSKVAIEMHGKRYVSDRSFDPSQLLKTNKLGVSPTGTTLTIIYRFNDLNTNNVSSNNLNTVASKIIEFDNEDALSEALKIPVIDSLEVNNESAISAGTSDLTNEELKVRAKNYYASQNRAVTKQDYESIIYNMPSKFGSVKRVNIVNDPSSTNRKISMYVISENNNGKLAQTNSAVKNNIKFWLQGYKMLNDSIEIFDTKIINIGIDFQISISPNYNASSVILAAKNKLLSDYSLNMYIGEPIYLSQIYSILAKVDGVLDVKKVKIYNKSGGAYSTTSINMKDLQSSDGTYYKCPQNAIFELKYSNDDIKGFVK